MRMLFCKISCMKYYKGHCDADVPLNGGTYVQEHGYGHEEFNFLPWLMEGERNRAKWSIPSARYTRAYGFGQSMVWYPVEEEAKPYLAKLLDSIDSYNEENWLRRFPPEE